MPIPNGHEPKIDCLTFSVSLCLCGESGLFPGYDCPMADDLHPLKDDMTAFILGHGLGRFRAHVNEEMQSVLWEAGDNPDSWKDFVELAKNCGVQFLTVSDDAMDKADIDFLIENLKNSDIVLDDELEEARLLARHTGKVGFIQIGFPYQGTMFLFEVSTPWYDRYQQLLESAENMGTILFDERESDEEQ